MIESARFRAIGVDCQIATTRADVLAAARGLAQARLVQLDTVASRFRPDSEIKQLAAMKAPVGRTTVTAPASVLLRSLVHEALWAANVSDGLVDPTLGRALEATGYNTDLAEVLARTAADGSTQPDTVTTGPPARRVSSLGDLRVDQVAGTVTIAAGALIDLGATAKASVADRIARDLAERWPGGFLVDLGGDIAVAGPPPIGGWVISIEEEACRDADRISITTQAVTTSCTDRRRWYVEGTLRHHLLDPATGLPVPHTWRRVTCVGASALEANTASTAACVLGDAAVSWLTTRGIPARLVPEHGEVVCTPGWPGDPWPEHQMGHAS